MERTRVVAALLCLFAVSVPTQAGDLSVKKQIGPAGGVVEIPGYVKAIIPPGALDQEVELGIRVIETPTTITPDVAKKLVGPIYDFGPEIKLLKPVEIRLYYRDDWIPPGDAEGDLAIFNLTSDGRMGIEPSETGEYFPESDGQDQNIDDNYVSVLTTYWAIARLLVAV